jgi:biotin transport system substrate-specific component
MLRTLTTTRDASLTTRLILVGAFAAITAIAARISIPMEPVPFTLQPLAVLLAAMVLGARDGMMSQLLYVALIAVGLPLDANMRGSVALFGPTGGYLVGFVVAAFVVGWIVERGSGKWLARLLGGVVGVAIIYAFGVPVLKLVTGMEWARAFEVGAGFFLLMDLVKVVIAAALAEGGRALVGRLLPGTSA